MGKFAVPALTLPVPDQDWYQFGTEAAGSVGDKIVLNVNGPNDAKMQLYTEIRNAPVGMPPLQPVSGGQGHTPINLAGLPTGTYFLQVSHTRQNIQFKYTMTILAPESGRRHSPAPAPG